MKQLLLLLGCASLSLGQAAAQQVIPPLKNEFLDSAWHVLPAAAGARYRRETEYRDSIAGEVRDYYLSGQLQSRTPYENVRLGLQNGTAETYYLTGQLETHEERRHGQPEGELLRYYAGGQLQSRATYHDGRLASSQCFNLNGQPMECPIVVEVMPVYSEGDGSARAIIEAVTRNFTYPRKALRRGTGGRVLVGFDVNRQGDVVNIRIEQSVSPPLDAAAQEAVRKLRKFRPGTQDGKPVSVHYTMPLNLRVQ